MAVSSPDLDETLSELQPIRIGVIQDFTIGAWAVNPVLDLWEWKIARDGGLLVGDTRRRVEFIKYDMKSKAALAARGAKKLTSKDKVSAILQGGYTAAHCIAVANVTDPLKVAYFHTLPDESTWKPFNWVSVAGQVTADELARAFMKLIDEIGTPNTVGIFGIKEAAIRARVQPIKKRLKLLGTQVVYEAYHQVTDTDFREHLVKIKAAKPDLLIMDSVLNAHAIINRQISEIGGWGDIIRIGLTEHASNISAILEPGAIGMYVGVGYIPGVSETLGAKAFEEAWIEKGREDPAWCKHYGAMPGVTHSNVWVNTEAALRTIEMAGSEDPAAIAEMARSGSVQFESARGFEHLNADGSNEEKFAYCRVEPYFSPTDANVKDNFLPATNKQFALALTSGNVTKNMIQEILTYQEDLRSLVMELSLAEQRERERIATQLHDTIGQNLFGCRFKLAALAESAPGSCFARELESIQSLVKQLVDDVSSFVFELSPPFLHELGLEAALKRLGDQISEQYDIPIVFHDDDPAPKPLEDNTRVLLFQSVRELLMNAVKHSKADTVTVRITRRKDDIRILVEDNGVGFDVSGSHAEANGRRGFGLFSIRERLRHIGGQFEIDSSPGSGSRFALVAPLRKDQN